MVITKRGGLIVFAASAFDLQVSASGSWVRQYYNLFSFAPADFFFNDWISLICAVDHFARATPLILAAHSGLDARRICAYRQGHAEGRSGDPRQNCLFGKFHKFAFQKCACRKIVRTELVRIYSGLGS